MLLPSATSTQTAVGIVAVSNPMKGRGAASPLTMALQAVAPRLLIFLDWRTLAALARLAPVVGPLSTLRHVYLRRAEEAGVRSALQLAAVVSLVKPFLSLAAERLLLGTARAISVQESFDALISHLQQGLRWHSQFVRAMRRLQRATMLRAKSVPCDKTIS
jgi:hypothetical protein